MSVVGEVERIGPYRLLRRLGQGGMGVVYLASDDSGQEVALKVLRPHVAHDDTALARLEREVSTLQRVDHPGVAGILGQDLACDRPYLVIRYVPGRQLDHQVESRGPLTPQRWLPLAGRLAEALQAIHRAGIVHRDVKPGNVLMLDGKPVLIDFGIAQAADDLRLTATGLVIGTPGYLAPEMIAGEAVTDSADWWGWAATAVFAATGRRPFGRGPFEAVLHRVHSGQIDTEGIDPRIEPMLRAALSPDRRDRPTSAEIFTGLNRYAEGRDALPPTGRTVTALVGEPGTTRVVTKELPADEPPAPPRPAGPTPTQVAALVPPVFPKLSMPKRTVAPVVRQQPPDLVPYQPPPAPQQQPVRPPEPAPSRPVKPRSTGPRTGTMLALLVVLSALAARFPAAAVLLLIVLLLIARTVDRTGTSLLRRRQTRGRSKSDGMVAAAASPVHLATAALITAPCLILPAIVGGSVAAMVGAGAAADRGLDWQPLTGTAIAAGCFAGLLAAWWGPGGSSVRRGARTIVRATLRPPWLTAIVVLGLLGLATLCLVSVANGTAVSWAPLDLPERPDLPDLPGIDLPSFGRTF